MRYELQRGDFTLSTDPARLDTEAVCAFLSNTYWAKHRPRQTMLKAIQHSLCFGVYRGPEQVGFARAITDYATFAYMADVYILEPFRRRGLARWLVESMLAHPELKGLRRWFLLTQDAHELYQKCGFAAAAHPDHVMERLQPYPTGP